MGVRVSVCACKRKNETEFGKNHRVIAPGKQIFMIHEYEF